MRKKQIGIACLVALIFGLFMVNSAMAGCSNDPLVRQWVHERDQAAEKMVQRWAAGVPLTEVIYDAAVIFSNEVYIASRCRQEEDFLNSTIVLPDAGPDVSLETLPAILIEKLIGKTGFFSPYSQFPIEKTRGDL